MNKCINCAYFLNCENANEENTCNKYKFIRKNIKRSKSMEEDTKRQIEQLIEIKNIERQIADLFYRMCPNVPPQLLASTVMQTIGNFKELDSLYNPKIEIKVRKYKDDAANSLRYFSEGILSKDTIIGKPETATEIKLLQEYENHIPRID